MHPTSVVRIRILAGLVFAPIGLVAAMARLGHGYGEELGPRMLARTVKRTGLTPDDR